MNLWERPLSCPQNIEMQEQTCPYCETQTVGPFCHQCGQKQGVHRLEWKYLLQDLQKRLFGFDNNFFRTVKDLTIRPGKVVQSTIEGIRVRYIGPIGYFFLMLTLFILITSILEVDMMELSSSINKDLAGETTEQQEKIQRQFGESIFSNFRIVSFLMMPLFILGIYLIFKNKKYNFLETSVVMFYAQGHSMIFSIAAVLIYWGFDYSNAMSLSSPISFGYIAFVCASFYQGNAIWNFVKGLLGLLIGFVLIIVIAMIAGIIYVLMNPEIVQELKPAA